MLVIVTIEDPRTIGETIDAAKSELLGDPFRTQLASVRELQERSFRYSADHHVVRERVLQAIGSLEFKAHVWYSDGGRKIQWMGELLNAFVASGDRKKSAALNLYIAEGDQIRDDKHEDILPKLIKMVPMPGKLVVDRKLRVRALRANDPCQVLPDYICGLLHDALENGSQSSNALPRLLRGLTGRLQTVVDVQAGVISGGDVFLEDLRRRSETPHAR